MNKRAFLYLAVTTVILVSLLFIISFFALSPLRPKSERLSYNYVRGSAIEHGGLLYTLNFEQQNALIQAINGAEKSRLSQLPSHNLPFTKLIIYRFNAPDIEITPIAYINDNLIFSSSEWNEAKPLIEKGQGQLKLKLENSYEL